MSELAFPGFHKWNAKIAANSDQTFQCTICYDRLSKPIITCTTGHLFCHPCSGKVNDCPLCHTDFTANGNLALNNILESSTFPCKNKQSGCKLIKIYAEIREHEEQTCNYKRLQCCLNADLTNTLCQEMTLLHEFRSHVEIQHKRREKIYSDDVLRKDVVIDFGQNIKTTELIEVVSEESERSHFYLEKIMYSGQKQMLCISYHYVGRVEQARNYTYELKMVDSKDPNLFLTHKNRCLQIGLTDEHIQNSGRSLLVCTKSLMSSLERRKILKYSVKFDYVYNEKKMFKKKEFTKFEKDSKKDLCEEESEKCEKENNDFSKNEDKQKKGEKIVEEKTNPEEKNKRKVNNLENEIEEDNEEIKLESRIMVKTMFVCFLCYVLYLCF